MSSLSGGADAAELSFSTGETSTAESVGVDRGTGHAEIRCAGSQ
jgi:hypothetical protein